MTLKKQIDRDLQAEIDKLKQDDVELILNQTPPDNSFVIKTKHHQIEIGVNDLGFWLIKDNKDKKEDEK